MLLSQQWSAIAPNMRIYFLTHNIRPIRHYLKNEAPSQSNQSIQWLLSVKINIHCVVFITLHITSEPFDFKNMYYCCPLERKLCSTSHYICFFSLTFDESESFDCRLGLWETTLWCYPLRTTTLVLSSRRSEKSDLDTLNR